MVKLVPMTPGEFDVFLEHGIKEYAKDRVRAGFWTETESLPRSRKEHRALLPDGMMSRYHHFYTIQDAESGDAVGILWLKTDLDSSRGSGFVFDLEIHEPVRRKGYARQAMLELENVARGMGLPIAIKSLSVAGRDRVVHQHKQPFRDGSTNVVLEPLPTYELSQFRSWPIAAITAPRLRA